MKGKLKERGITLVALVVTIIIILILAGVTISQITGENGLIKRTTQAKEEYEKESLKEEIRLAVLDKRIEKNGELSEDEIIKLLGEYGDVKTDGEGKVTLEPNGTSYKITYEEIMNGETTNDTAGGDGSGSSSSGDSQDKVEVSKEEFNQMQEKLKKLDELDKRLTAIDEGTTSILSLNDAYNKNPKMNRIFEWELFDSSTELKDTGVKCRIPANSYYCLGFFIEWRDSKPLEMQIKSSIDRVPIADVFSSNNDTNQVAIEPYTLWGITSGSEKEISIYEKSQSNGQNAAGIVGFYIDRNDWLN